MTPFIASHIAASIPENPTPEERTHAGNTASLIGIVLNILLALGKGTVGFIAGSVSIVADSVNNLSDAASSIVSLVGFKLASRPADEGHPYGHGRFEYLAGLVVAVMVCAVGLELINSSVRKILDPEPVEFGWAIVVVLLGSIAVKLWMAHFNKLVGRKIDSETLQATSVDARNDVITTSAVLATSLISYLWGVDLDGICGCAVGVFILVSGAQLVKDTISPLLGQAPSAEYVQHIHDTIMSYPGVLGTHDLMVHDYGPGRQFASAHVEMPAEESVMKSHDTLDNIEQDFKDKEGLIISLHLDPIVTDDPEVKDLRNWIAEHVKTIDPAITVHDLRCVPGPTHTNVIFDVVKPFSLEMSDEELRREISAIVKSHKKDAVPKITVDHSYVSTRQ